MPTTLHMYVPPYVSCTLHIDPTLLHMLVKKQQNATLIYHAITIHGPLMPYTCYMKLKALLSLRTVAAMSVQSATGHCYVPIGLICCEIMKGKLQFSHMLILCKNLQKELIIGLDMQQLY